ncbi:MAG: amino acid transporter [Parachlamydiaceae bacterium]|nr:amino acid transporter [Parachlamydiaceae bacterium]
MFLVAGTCIGGGMLALPVATGVSGFLPSITIMAICWFAMTLTGLLLLEVSLWMEEGVHIITMTSRLLGTPGKVVSWILYTFVCYASLVGYTAGGGAQMANAINTLFGLELSRDLGSLIFLIIFGVVVDLGSQIIGRVNTILFTAMICAYFALIGIGIDEVKESNLWHARWPISLLAVPLTLTTFSFQTMVPSLTPYLKRNGRALRLAVIGGTTITFLVYLIWQWLILGIVPVEGPNGLVEALRLGEPATIFLNQHVQGVWISTVAEYFAFFAIVTSFLGIGLGLVDFLSDGLKIKNAGMGKLLLGALIMIPTLVFATQLERVFILAMEWSGGIGDSILNGMIPVLMVWIGRYKMGYDGTFRVPGGKPLLVLTFIIFFLAFALQIAAYLIPSAAEYVEDAFKVRIQEKVLLE